MEIGEKLSKLQQDMKVPKDQYNKFGKFYYRNAETILAEFKKYEKDLKVFLTLKDEIVEAVGKVYVKATATLVDCESDEEISVTAYARESEEKKGMDEAQITGSVSSYARKYALNGLFLLDDVKDPDSNEYEKQKNQDKSDQKEDPDSDEYEKQKNQDKSDQKDGKSTSSNIKINQNHINSLRSLFTENGIDESKVLVLYKVQKIEALTINQYKNAFDHVKELKESCSV